MADEDNRTLEEATPLTAILLREYGEILSDPNVSEEKKNTFSMLVAMLSMREYRPPDSWVGEWHRKQSAILEELKHLVPGSVVKLYNPDEDGQSGAYLEVDLERYQVIIDVEDVETMEQYQERRVVSVDVHHLPTEEDPERGEIFNSGMVETMEEAGELVEHLRQDRFDEAMRMLFRLGTFDKFKVPRTPENLEAVVKKSALQYTVSRWEP